MPVKAAVAIPTQRRAPYLEVALASIVPQAHAAGAEVLVVDDGPDEATRARRRAPRRALPPPRRAARPERRAQYRAAGHRRPLVCFVDDDVEVRPGWLDALLAAATACPDEVAVLTGPIRARFEDHRFRTCGREGPPVTFLDLGARRPRLRPRVGRQHGGPPQRGRARRALRRGARALRRRAGVAGAREGRRRADPLRRRRRARPPPRGRRRAPARRCAAPPTAAAWPAAASTSSRARRRRWRRELRVLAGCAAARPAARVHERPGAHRALARAPARGAGGTDRRRPRRGLPVGHQRRRSAASAARCCARATRGSTCARRRGARACAAPRAASRRAGACSRWASSAPARSWPPRARELVRSRHAVDVVTAPQGERGKFENLNALLAAHPPRPTTGCSSSTTTSRCRAASSTPSCAPPSAPA